jgi:hypothetical protein
MGIWRSILPLSEDSKHRCTVCKYYIEGSIKCIPFNPWTGLPVKLGNVIEIFREDLNGKGLCPYFIIDESMEKETKMKEFIKGLMEKIRPVIR